MKAVVLKVLLIFFVGTLTLGSQVVEAIPVSGIDVGPETVFGNDGFSVGWAFAVNADISVTELGYYNRIRIIPDVGAVGMGFSHEVGLYSTSGILLASATVNPSDPLINGFRYTAIPQLALSANTHYIIAGLNLVDTDGYIAASSFSTPSEITFLEGRLIQSTSLAFPSFTANVGGASIFGPNFRYSIPEPSIFILLGGALLGWIFFQKMSEKRK